MDYGLERVFAMLLNEGERGEGERKNENKSPRLEERIQLRSRGHKFCDDGSVGGLVESCYFCNLCFTMTSIHIIFLTLSFFLRTIACKN